VYACLSYEMGIHNDPAIVCMPTGTGKTAVIATIILKCDFKRTLIIVPSDALRQQIGESFSNIEKYKKWKVISLMAEPPKTSLLKATIQSESDLDLVDNNHVVVSTAQSLLGTDADILERFIKKFDRVIFDEAHHVEADGWGKIREYAIKNESKIYQFTATPYRLDAKKIDGRVIYRYSIKEACNDGLFAKINFVPVEEYYESKADEAIAKEAIRVLEEDLNNGFTHVLMARASTVKLAKEIQGIYERLTTRRVACVHSKMKENDKKQVLEDLKNGLIQIIVCVDMLGEGYDFPELKICALHSHKKSLPVFFQLIGRFTRVSSDKNLGEAKIVANTVDENIIGLFGDLFKMDSEWNSILHGLNEAKIEDEFASSDIAAEIKNSDLKSVIERNNLLIKCSAQAFEYRKDISAFMDESKLLGFLKGNFDDFCVEVVPDNNLGVILARKSEKVSWASESNCVDSFWYIFIILAKYGHIFIHGEDRRLVGRIATTMGIPQVKGQNIFRVFSDLDLALFSNVGVLSNNVDANFIMYTGNDVFNALSDAERGSSHASNLFGHGFIDGIKTSIGCSRKGIFWSMRSVKIIEWIKWCESCISKIMDNSIDNKAITNGMMDCQKLKDIDDMLIYDLSTYKLFKKHGDKIGIKVLTSLNNYRINIDDYSVSFVSHEKSKIKFSLDLFLAGYEQPFSVLCSWDYVLGFSVIDRSSLNKFKVLGMDSIDFLKELDLAAWTDDFSFFLLNDKELFIPRLSPDIDKSYIKAIDWSGFDLNVESWEYGRFPKSVQGKMIEIIKKNNPLILFYDDAKDELADLVEFQVDDVNSVIEISLYHCKFFSGKYPSSTIGSVTELVQQSISSIARLSNLDKSLKSLKRRELTASKSGKTRFVDGIGDMSDLASIIKKKNKYKKKYKIYMVQPGLSEAALNERVNTNLASVASIIKKTIKAETYFYISP